MTGRMKLVPCVLATLAAAAVMSPAYGAVRPDDRAGPLGVQQAGVTAVGTDRSDVFTRAVVRDGPAAVATVSVPTSTDAGFHWLDAGIGAAVGVVACLALLLVTGRLLRPQRNATAH